MRHQLESAAFFVLGTVIVAGGVAVFISALAR
jgi:hypothetical protein